MSEVSLLHLGLGLFFYTSVFSFNYLERRFEYAYC